MKTLIVIVSLATVGCVYAPRFGGESPGGFGGFGGCPSQYRPNGGRSEIIILR